MKEALLKKHPELEGILNKLAGKITESQMSQMNYQVGVEGKPAAKSRTWVFGQTGTIEEMIKQEKIQETLLRLCEHYGEQNWWQSDNKIEDLVSTILIQRITEKNAKLALAGLMDVMTVEDILALPLEDLQERIRPAGFLSKSLKRLEDFWSG